MNRCCSAWWRRSAGNLSPARPAGFASTQTGDPARQGHRALDQRRRQGVRRTTGRIAGRHSARRPGGTHARPGQTLRAERQGHCAQEDFQDKRKTLHEIGAYTTLEILLNAFCGAALEQHGGRTPSFKSRRILDLLGNNAPDPHGPLHTSFLRMIDFIAGMTDSYASDMALEMTGRSSH